MRETEAVWGGEGQRESESERDRDRETERERIPSRLSAGSTEPDSGLKPMKL